MTAEALRTYLAAEASSRFGPGSDEHFDALRVVANSHPQPDARPAPHTLPRKAASRPPVKQRTPVSPLRMMLLGMDR